MRVDCQYMYMYIRVYKSSATEERELHLNSRRAWDRARQEAMKHLKKGRHDFESVE